MVTIEIQGKPYQVPEGITAIQALWYTGHELIKGLGCLGGVCGACTFSYRKRGEPGIMTGLACATLVQEGMCFSPPVSLSAVRARYRISEIEDPKAGLFQYYPETRRCTRCNACTMVCPQNIDVRACVVKSISGEFDAVSEMFYNCVMCGLCTAVCDVGIKPNLVALYARRCEGAHLTPQPQNLVRRLKEIQHGVYASELKKILTMDEKGLQSWVSELS